MTEDQMDQRMKDISEEMKKLRLEQKEYEKYFSDKKEKEKLESHKNFVGKCYINKELKENNNGEDCNPLHTREES